MRLLFGSGCVCAWVLRLLVAYLVAVVLCVYLLVVVGLVCDSWFECSLDFGLLIVGLMCLLVWYGWL